MPTGNFRDNPRGPILNIITSTGRDNTRPPQANNKSSEVFDIIKPGRRVKIKVTGSKLSITSDDSLFAARSIPLIDRRSWRAVQC